jgi:hypothetical protein
MGYITKEIVMSKQRFAMCWLTGLMVLIAFQSSYAAGSLPVVAGTLTCEYDASDSISSYPAFGPHGYALICGWNYQANPILDLGAYRWVNTLSFTNRSVTTSLAINTTQVFVAANDAVAFTDGIQITDFNFAASSASSPVPSVTTASQVRTLSLGRAMYCRYLKIVTTANFNGIFQSGTDRDRVHVGELAVSGTAPAQAVTAGTVNTLGGRDSLSAYPQFGTHGFLVNDSDSNNLVQLVVDQGSAQFIDMLQITNRADADSQFSPKTVRCLVAADENAPGFDPQLLSSYTQQIGLGDLTPAGSAPGAVRSLDLSNVTRRYILLVVSANVGVWNPTQIGDIAFMVSPPHEVTAGMVNTLGRQDGLLAYPQFGPHGFLVNDSDYNNLVQLVVDQGSDKFIDMLQITNRADADSQFSPKTVRCLVAADENAPGFDPQLLSSYTQEIGSGDLTPSIMTAGTVRSLDLSNVTRRYMLLVISANIGTWSPTQIGDIAFVVPPASVNASDYGYNETDATSALQAAICTRARVVHVPNIGTDWIVRTIYLVADQEIVFEDGVSIVAKRGEFHEPGDCLFIASDIANLKLTGTNTTFKMWKSDYADGAQYTAGEWRHGVAFYGCDNITISGITIKETGGDGIYVGASWPSGDIPCSNIVIQNVACDSNYRQGMSVVSVDNLTVDNCIFRATSGTAPMAGIDFEPNSSQGVLSNITIKNSIFETNDTNGIAFSTIKLADHRNYQALVENCTFYGNKSSGFYTAYSSPQLVVKDCLFVNNINYGVCNYDSISISTTYCGYWGNTSGAVNGLVTLGIGCLTLVQPTFASTTFGDANYMALAANCPAAIAQGASDGGYMGAKPKVSVPAIPGDANGDGSVDVGDLGILAANYGTSSGATWQQGDFNGDKAVDVGDLGILAANYGYNGSSADWNADYAKVFGSTANEASNDTDSSLCGSLGLPLIAGLALAAGLMIVKLEE